MTMHLFGDFLQVVGIALAVSAALIGALYGRDRRRDRRAHEAEVRALAQQRTAAAMLDDRTIEIPILRSPEDTAAHRAHQWVTAGRAWAEQRDREQAKAWRTGYDALIAEQEARWRALGSRWDAELGPIDENKLFVPLEIVPVSPAPTTPTDALAALAEFDPQATLDMIEADNAHPTWYTWTTQDQQMVMDARKGVIKYSTRDRRRQRKLARRLAAGQLVPTS